MMILSRVRSLIALTAAIFATPALDAGPGSAEFLGASQLAASAHSSDGSDRARDGKPRFTGQLGARGVTYKGYQYVVYFTGKDRSKPKAEQFGEVFVARRKAGGSEWERARIAGYRLTSDDAHNRPSIAISEGDGRIHITFDHHNHRWMNYANTAVGVAENPGATNWDDTTFTYRRNFGWKAFSWVVTYPSFVKTGDGDLLLYFRDGGSYGGEMQKVGYDSKIGAWETQITRISSQEGTWNGQQKTRGPYLSNGIQVGTDGSLQMSWLFREKECQGNPKGELYCNHGLYYAKSSDGGKIWQRYDNSVVADTSKREAISIDNIGKPVVPLPYEVAPSNPANMSVIDPKTGDFHVLISHLAEPNEDSSRKTFHYVGKSSGDADWTGKSSGFTLGGADLVFAGDFLFAFGSQRADPEIYVASRSDNFASWIKIGLPDVGDLPGSQPRGGYSNWDTSRLSEGLVSLIWQMPDADGKEGVPTPVWVIDYRVSRQ